MATDKRAHPRHLKRVRLRYRTATERWRPAFSKDIATYGIYITTTAIPESRDVEVEVINDEEIIHLRGRILRGEKVPPKLRGAVQGGFALQLVDVPDAWCRLCLDLEEKVRERGGVGNPRFISVTTEVNGRDED